MSVSQTQFKPSPGVKSELNGDSRVSMLLSQGLNFVWETSPKCLEDCVENTDGFIFSEARIKYEKANESNSY